MMLVIEWLKANWTKLGYPLAALFAFLWWNKTTPCPVLAPTTQAVSQGATQSGSAKVKVQIVYRDRPLIAGESPRPLPCPDITVDADSAETQEHWQSVTQTANLAPGRPVEPLNTISLGIGYLEGPIASVGYRGGRLGIQGMGWEGRYGLGLTVDTLKW
jgi:hypothetical protein